MRSALIARDSTSETLRTADNSLWVEKEVIILRLLVNFFIKVLFLFPNSLDLGQVILEIFINKAVDKCPTLLLIFQKAAIKTKKWRGVVPALLYTEIFQIQNGEIHKIKSSK